MPVLSTRSRDVGTHGGLPHGEVKDRLNAAGCPRLWPRRRTNSPLDSKQQSCAAPAHVMECGINQEPPHTGWTLLATQVLCHLSDASPPCYLALQGSQLRMTAGVHHSGAKLINVAWGERKKLPSCLQQKARVSDRRGCPGNQPIPGATNKQDPNLKSPAVGLEPKERPKTQPDLHCRRQQLSHRSSGQGRRGGQTGKLQGAPACAVSQLPDSCTDDERRPEWRPLQDGGHSSMVIGLFRIELCGWGTGNKQGVQSC